jgi:CYTH domain-containing protein
VIEIERKFLVKSNAWKKSARGVRYRQGYLGVEKGAVVRVRTMGKKAALTVKGPSRGASRAEFEYPIPYSEAAQLLRFCAGRIIEKTRYCVRFQGHVWEIDVFHGRHQGLVVAEIELKRESQSFALPPWIGREVTGRRRYDNSSLARTSSRL